jgi:hypothetical protein
MKPSTKSRLSVAAFFTSFVLACAFGVLVLWVPAVERATAIAPTVPNAAQVMILRASHLVNQPWLFAVVGFACGASLVWRSTSTAPSSEGAG